MDSLFLGRRAIIIILFVLCRWRQRRVAGAAALPVSIIWVGRSAHWPASVSGPVLLTPRQVLAQVLPVLWRVGLLAVPGLPVPGLSGPAGLGMVPSSACNGESTSPGKRWAGWRITPPSIPPRPQVLVRDGLAESALCCFRRARSGSPVPVRECAPSIVRVPADSIESLGPQAPVEAAPLDRLSVVWQHRLRSTAGVVARLDRSARKATRSRTLSHRTKLGLALGGFVPSRAGSDRTPRRASALSRSGVR